MANPRLFTESSFLDQAFLLVTCVPSQSHPKQGTAALTLERDSSHLCFSWFLPGLAEPEVFHPWFNMDGWLLPLMINNLGQCHVGVTIIHCDCDGANVHCGVVLHLPLKLVIVLPRMEPHKCLMLTLSLMWPLWI